MRRWGILQGAVAAPAANTGSVVLSLLAAGVVGFFGGAEFGGYEYVELQPAQPPPPPLAAQQLPPGRTYPGAERVSLTVSEQAARQQIRLDSAPPRAQNVARAGVVHSDARPRHRPRCPPRLRWAP